MAQKFAFITGVSSGIGFGLYQSFLEAGYITIGTVRNPSDAQKLAHKSNSNSHILVFDVQNIEHMNEEMEKISHILNENRLDILINNAGIAVPGPLELLTEHEFEQQLDVNVKAVRRITNKLLPYLKVDKPGRIINISSISGLFNSPFNGAYCISKHALESMTEIYRRELMSFGVQVVSIQPGPIKTEIWKKNIGSLNKYFDSEYGPILKKADKMIENSEKNALPVEDVIRLVWRIINTKNPRINYLIHKKKWTFLFLIKIIPNKWVDKLVAKTLKNSDQYRPV